MIGFKDYIEEKFLQDLLTPDEFRRELEQKIEDAGYSPKVIKKISKKRKGYEVKVASYMGSLRDIFTDMGATKINFRKGGGVNTIMVEGIGFKDFLLTNPGMEKDAQIAYRRMKRRKSQDYGNNNEDKKGLWHNINQKRKRGEKMRKKGEKGAPTAAAMKSAQGK